MGLLGMTEGDEELGLLGMTAEWAGAADPSSHVQTMELLGMTKGEEELGLLGMTAGWAGSGRRR
jgi:hypothetical protein